MHDQRGHSDRLRRGAVAPLSHATPQSTAAAARTSRTDDLFIAILERVARQNGIGAGAPAKGKLYASKRMAA
jgi:hypothetical protein